MPGIVSANVSELHKREQNQQVFTLEMATHKSWSQRKLKAVKCKTKLFLIEGEAPFNSALSNNGLVHLVVEGALRVN